MSDQAPESESILETAEENPEAVDVDKVVGLLDHEEGQARNVALMALVRVANHDPDLVVDHTDRFIDALDDDFPVAASTAAQVLSRISPEYPEEAAPAIPRLVDMLDDIPPLTGYRAGRALVPLLEYDPEAFVAGGDRLVDVLTNPPSPDIPKEDEWAEMDPEEREKTNEILESRAFEAKQDIARAFGVRELTANALVEVTEREPELVADRIDEIAEWVDDGPPIVRNATIDTVANVAKHDQAAVEPAIDPLIGIALNDSTSVRAHAIQALGFAGATEAIEPLRVVAESDAGEVNDDLRELAAETADFLENEA